MNEEMFLGLGRACWVEGCSMGVIIISIIVSILMFAGILYGIYGNIKNIIERQEYLKEMREKYGTQYASEKTKEEKVKEFKKAINDIGKIVLASVGLFVYFWIIGTVIKMMGKCG